MAEYLNYQPFKHLLARYPVRPQHVAMGPGRFPRFWLLASLGTWIHLEGRVLGWLAVIPASVVVVGLVRAADRRRRRMVLALPTPEPVPRTS